MSDEVRVVAVGPVALVVEQVGLWEPGEVRYVPADLAARLLIRDDFAAAPALPPPEDDSESETEPVVSSPSRLSRRRPSVDGDAA